MDPVNPYTPPPLDEADMAAFRQWLDIRPESNPLMAAGADRNARRYAQAWGEKLLATLLRNHSAVVPGEDPVEVLEKLLRGRAALHRYAHSLHRSDVAYVYGNEILECLGESLDKTVLKGD